MKKCDYKTISVEESIKSAPIWTSIFTGLKQSKHRHKDFVIDGELQERKDIQATFIWEEIDVDTVILQAPVVIPPINYNAAYEPEGFGISSDLEELETDWRKLLQKSKEVLKKDPEFFAVVFMQLDRVSHFYWDDREVILDWYKKMDQMLGELLDYYNFDGDEPLVVLSDHGFAEFGEGRVQTLPEETPHGKLKGDHHEEAVLIKNNFNYDISQPEDVGKSILDYYGRKTNK